MTAFRFRSPRFSDSIVKQRLNVVPAKAGTHIHRLSLLRESRRTASSNTRDTAYGSLLSQGRQNTHLRILATEFRPSDCKIFAHQRAQGMPGASMRPQPRVQK